MRRGASSPGIGVLRIVALLLVAAAPAQHPQPTGDGPRSSPVTFRHPVADLLGDLNETDRGDRRLEASTSFREWYSDDVRKKMGAWGPRARAYPPFPGLEQRSVEWLRERAVAVGLRYVGYDYQHHHVPDWDPPADWPWKPVGSGKNGRGVDCSNFTGFVYNQGFGIRLNTNVADQAELKAASMADGRKWPIRRIELPDSFEKRIHTLKMGDLVYIRGRPDGPITHVVIWVGPIDRSAPGLPWVLDSHGSGIVDDSGRTIPAGVQLRPFRERSWYNRAASHALRVLDDP